MDYHIGGLQKRGDHVARKVFIERGAGKPAWFVRLGLNSQRVFFKMSNLPGMGQVRLT